MKPFLSGMLAGLLVLALVGVVGICSDTHRVREESVSGDILDVGTSRNSYGYTNFTVTLDLDNGAVVICPVSRVLGGTLYRLYRNRKPGLPRLRETARVQVGRHSGSMVCRGLAMAAEIEQTGDKQ